METYLKKNSNQKINMLVYKTLKNIDQAVATTCNGARSSDQNERAKMAFSEGRNYKGSSKYIRQGTLSSPR